MQCYWVCSTAVSLVVGVAQFVPPNLRDLVLCGVRSTPELTKWGVIFNKGAFLFLTYCVSTSHCKKFPEKTNENKVALSEMFSPIVAELLGRI